MKHNCLLLKYHTDSPPSVSNKTVCEIGWIGCASSLVDPKGIPGFFHTFSMTLYHKWEVINDFVYVLQFFSLISDSLGSVCCLEDPLVIDNRGGLSV